jgi:pyruvate formate lyase activating enzyme
VYGRVASEHLDPIEKKPFYHVLPGSQSYSIATAGCTMSCKFCQNWELSQSKPEDINSRAASPEDITKSAAGQGAKTIAYTYNEPTVFTEFVYDCAHAGNKHGIRSIVVSNGYILPEPLDRLADVITAYKVDFKAFSKSFYRDVTGGDLDSVLATIKRLHTRNIWTELVHLTIPTLNDRDEDFSGMADWLMSEVGEQVPVHFTRFYPQYRLTNLPVTPVSTLERARAILMDKGMKYVYIGNVPGHPGNSTYCPNCGTEVIIRRGYATDTIRLKNGSCMKCGTAIPGIWA